MKGKLFLIDGHALIFKMYYAFLGRPMINSKGVDTSILYGFTKYLLELLEREHPTHVAVSFDPPGGTFRNVMYPEYKANRTETPQLVIDALEPLTEIVKALNIPVLMIPGFEADDVIGSMAKRSAREGFDVYMVTPDKDYGQLIEEHIFQYKPGKAGGENEVIDSAKVCEKYGISSPLQVIDILTICGDAADNVPGVKGVGEVGASKLLSKYGSVESIYQHLDELTARQKSLFEAAADHIGLSRQLVTIKTDIDLEATAEDMVLNPSFSPQIADLFEKYEFRSLKRTLTNVSAGAAVSEPIPEEPAADLQYKALTPSELIQKASREGCCAIEVQDGMVRVAVLDSAAEGSAEEFRILLEDGKTAKGGFGLKAQMNALAKEGVSLGGRLLDIELMHYLLNPERNHQLPTLAKSYLGVDLEPQSPASSGSLFGDDEAEPAAEDRLKGVVAARRIADKVLKEMADGGLQDLYDKIEEPLSKVLSSMELTGVRIDVQSLRDFADMLRSEVLRHEAAVREITGEPNLNVGSPKQIGEVLFEKMKLDPKAKKPSKGSWSTDEETLLALADKSPVIDEILEYRGTKKLLSTYIDPLPGFISPVDGRVHTTFNQALTSTGRLSSSNPNLQNIPIRTDQGKEIRKAFVAEGEDSVIMSADYSQIELRIMAHLSCDQHLISAFRAGQDVHAATAAKIFGKEISEVTSSERRIAKTANFGIMYGISSFGLAQRLRCSRSEAKQIIEDYFASFPSIQGFINDTLASTRETGYAETLFGRRRYLPDINSHNATMRAIAERNAVNAPIQGTAADIIKLAMIGVDRALRENSLRSRMVLQIHDELVLEVPQDEIEKVRGILVSEMENVISLSVPLTVECNYGKNWLEAH